jgi:hypothetical protein
MLGSRISFDAIVEVSSEQKHCIAFTKLSNFFETFLKSHIEHMNHQEAKHFIRQQLSTFTQLINQWLGTMELSPLNDNESIDINRRSSELLDNHSRVIEDIISSLQHIHLSIPETSQENKVKLIHRLNFTESNSFYLTNPEELLGCGSFGKVVVGLNHRNPYLKYAIKTMEGKGIERTKIEKEALMMYLLSNSSSRSNIVNCFGFVHVSYDCSWIIMELAPYGSIDKLLNVELYDRLPVVVKIHWMRDLIQALAFLHSFTKPVLHKDVKPGNALVFHGLQVKLADFGFAKELMTNAEYTSAHGLAGTYLYMAPEQLLREGSSTKSDVYQWGRTALRMLLRASHLLSLKDSEAFSVAFTISDEQIDGNSLEQLRRFIEGSLSKVENRLSAETIVVAMNGLLSHLISQEAMKQQFDSYQAFLDQLINKSVDSATINDTISDSSLGYERT